MSWTMLKVHIPVVALPLFISMAFALTTPGGPLNPTTSDSGTEQAPHVAGVGSTARHQDEDAPRVVSSTPTPPPSETPPPFVSSLTPDSEPVLSAAEGTPAATPPAATSAPTPPATPLQTPPPPATTPPPTPAPATPAPTPSPVPPMTADQACAQAQAYVAVEMASVVVTFKSCSAELINGPFLTATKIHNPACAATNGPCQHHSLTLKLYVYDNGSIVPADAATTLILQTY